MSGRPAIVVVTPPGGARDALVAALEGRSVVCVDDPSAIALGPEGRLLLTIPEHLPALRQALGPAAAMLALIEPEAPPDPALQAGADDVVIWPGSPALLRKRVAVFLDGDLGMSRVLLDPRRVTSLVHAVRNPLNVITLYAELLKMEPLTDEAHGSVGRLVRAAKRVDALVGELETLLYLEAGMAPVRSQPTELGELVHIVLAELSYDIEDKPLEVVTDLAEAGTLALADPDLTRRVLHAVLGRVVKLALGHSRVTIRTRPRPLRLEIEAPITPIPPEQVPALHSPATELDAREALGGVGVGLSFAHRALEAMSARLEHDATPKGEALTRLVFTSAP